MKKKLLICALTLTFAFTGCSASSTSSTSSTASTAAADTSTAQEAADEAGDTTAETSDMTSPDLDIEVSDKTLADGKVSDFVTIGEYKGMQLSVPEDTAAETGMTANIAFSGTVVGEDAPRDGMTSDSYDLVLGSGSFIEGFEDALIGHKAGETVEFTIPFPENYGETTLAGKDTDWTVTIHSLSSGSTSSLYSNFVNETEIKAFPKDIYDDVTEYVTAIYTTSAKSNDQSLEEFLDSNGINTEVIVRSEARTWLTSRAIMEAEGITEESEDFTSMMTNILSVYGYSSLDEAVEAGYPASFLRSATTTQVALKIVEDNAK